MELNKGGGMMNKTLYFKYVYTFEVLPEKEVFTKEGVSKFPPEYIEVETHEEAIEYCIGSIANSVETALFSRGCNLLNLTIEEVPEMQYMAFNLKPENKPRYKLTQNKIKKEGFYI